MTATETVGVKHRVGYYDTVGSLQDMIPNHLFQAGFPISDGVADFV